MNFGDYVKLTQKRNDGWVQYYSIAFFIKPEQVQFYAHLLPIERAAKQSSDPQAFNFTTHRIVEGSNPSKVIERFFSENEDYPIASSLFYFTIKNIDSPNTLIVIKKHGDVWIPILKSIKVDLVKSALQGIGYDSIENTDIL